MKTYSFLDIQGTIVGPGGAIPIGNGAGIDEGGVDIDPTSEIDTMTIGADGEGMHSLHGDKSGKITVRVLKTSPTNGLLAAMLAFQRGSSSTHGQNTITFVDLKRGEVITCQQCAFTKAPAMNFGTQARSVEWEFNAIKIDLALGF